MNKLTDKTQFVYIFGWNYKNENKTHNLHKIKKKKHALFHTHKKEHLFSYCFVEKSEAKVVCKKAQFQW